MKKRPHHILTTILQLRGQKLPPVNWLVVVYSSNIGQCVVHHDVIKQKDVGPVDGDVVDNDQCSRIL